MLNRCFYGDIMKQSSILCFFQQNWQWYPSCIELLANGHVLCAFSGFIQLHELAESEGGRYKCVNKHRFGGELRRMTKMTRGGTERIFININGIPVQLLQKFFTKSLYKTITKIVVDITRSNNTFNRYGCRRQDSDI